MTNQPFNEKLASLFATLSEKVFKKGLDIKALERLQNTSKQIATCIIQAAEKTALVKCKALNDAVKRGFEKIAEPIDDHENRIATLEENYKAIHDVVTKTAKEVKNATEDFK